MRVHALICGGVTLVHLAPPSVVTCSNPSPVPARPIAGPGALLLDGEVAGTWRYRKQRSTLTISTFGRVPARRRTEAEPALEGFCAATGAEAVNLRWD